MCGQRMLADRAHVLMLDRVADAVARCSFSSRLVCRRVYREPSIVHLRSEDGRGALFWAHEYAQWAMIDFLLARGADPDATDATGNRPADLLPQGAKRPKNMPQLDEKQAAEQARQQMNAQRKAQQQAQQQRN
jgi:ankyrin repeat protein